MTAPYEAVILAAGRGSRLDSETREIPKALLPIGPRSLSDPSDREETCFLRRHLELLASFGVEQVVVVVGYLREQVFAALDSWEEFRVGAQPWVKPVINPAEEITASGSLDSFLHAARSPHGVLDGTRQTLLMDADIVYHRDVLGRLIEAPEESAMLVCSRRVEDNEEVLVYGTPERPRFMGKGLTPALVAGAPCIGEATGIVKIAPVDHALARETMVWMLGDQDAPAGDPRRKGFGPARQATEHEELTQRLMYYSRMRCHVFGEELPFMEVDSAEEVAELRQRFYPGLLRREATEAEEGT